MPAAIELPDSAQQQITFFTQADTDQARLSALKKLLTIGDGIQKEVMHSKSLLWNLDALMPAIAVFAQLYRLSHHIPETSADPCHQTPNSFRKGVFTRLESIASNWPDSASSIVRIMRAIDADNDTLLHDRLLLIECIANTPPAAPRWLGTFPFPSLSLGGGSVGHA